MRLADGALFDLSDQDRRRLRRAGVESARHMRTRMKWERRRRNLARRLAS